MEDLRLYAIFAETVSAGSMTAAARRLGMTTSAVSQSIRALERRAGVMLLHRSTRRLSATAAGERCLPHCMGLVRAGQAATAALAQARDAPAGELRIAAPIGFAAHLSPALAPVLADWPALRLRLLVDDRLIDLAAARIDVALRVGDLPDSSWIGRKLCAFDRILCASPAYLVRRGVPQVPADLLTHDWLAMGNAAEQAGTLKLSLHGPAATSQILDVPIRIGTTSQVALQHLCQEGMGLATMIYPDALPALDRGALVRLLPGWRLPPVAITMVTPTTDRETARAKIAAEALQRYFARMPTLP